MLHTNVTLDLLAHAIDTSALKQSVYTTNIANAGVDGYRRLEVVFDKELDVLRAGLGAGPYSGQEQFPLVTTGASVISTLATVKLDEEMGLMAKNALRYQMLLGLFERSMGSMRAAVREGKE